MRINTLLLQILLYLGVSFVSTPQFGVEVASV